MFKTVAGHYDGHFVILDEDVDIKEGTQVLVTALNLNIDKITLANSGEKPRDLNEAIEIFKRTYNIR